MNEWDATDAPAAIGPYSQGIRLGDLLFCSGCIPLDPSTAQIVPGGIEAQTEQALKNLKTVVEAGGSELGKVVKTTVCQKKLKSPPWYKGAHTFTGFPEIHERFCNGQWNICKILRKSCSCPVRS